jgi:hypothetical protein
VITCRYTVYTVFVALSRRSFDVFVSALYIGLVITLMCCNTPELTLPTVHFNDTTQLRDVKEQGGIRY